MQTKSVPVEALCGECIACLNLIVVVMVMPVVVAGPPVRHKEFVFLFADKVKINQLSVPVLE